MRALILTAIILFSLPTVAQHLNLVDTSTVDFSNPKVGQFIRLMYYTETETPDRLSPSMRTNLDSIIVKISQKQNIRWLIEVHTSCYGDSTKNIQFTKAIADNICNYLTYKTESIKFFCVGKGENDSVNGCKCEGTYRSRGCTEEENELNRRIYFKVTE